MVVPPGSPSWSVRVDTYLGACPGANATSADRAARQAQGIQLFGLWLVVVDVGPYLWSVSVGACLDACPGVNVTSADRAARRAQTPLRL